MLYIGSDHGGFQLKQQLVQFFKANAFNYEDVGTYTHLPCDYPQIAQKVAQKVLLNEHHRGVLICTTGVGMCITANKFCGIYAARLTQIDEVKKARQHNNINVLCLPGTLPSTIAASLVTTFLDTATDLTDRHQKRRAMIAEIEKTISVNSRD